MVNTIGRLTDREEKELQQETIAALEIYNTNEKKGIKKLKSLLHVRIILAEKLLVKLLPNQKKKKNL
jgi:hypothetical protein